MERFQSACVSADAQMNISAEPAPALENEKASFLADGMLIVVLLAVANFLLHLYFNNRYGYFRDEFDYMSCGDHLAWGYVDQPPQGDHRRTCNRIRRGSSRRSEEH